MASTSLTGKDTIQIKGRVLSDLADGDVANLTFPNELMNVKTGKNGNSIYAFNSTGLQCEMTLRVLRGSSDDKFLNSLLFLMQLDPAQFPLMTGKLVKRIGDGSGSVANDTYILTGGVFSKKVEAASNTEGSTDQSVSVYSLKFTNAPRAIL